MARYLVLDKDGNVLNVIEWDGNAQWTAPEGCTAVVAPETKAEIGEVFDVALDKITEEKKT